MWVTQSSPVTLVPGLTVPAMEEQQLVPRGAGSGWTLRPLVFLNTRVLPAVTGHGLPVVVTLRMKRAELVVPESATIQLLHT